jgi:hypothetical protein
MGPSSLRAQVARLVEAFRSGGTSADDAEWIASLSFAGAFAGLERTVEAPPAWRPKFEPAFGTQLSVLSGRLLRSAYRHPVLVALHWTATAAVALGLGLVRVLSLAAK